MPPNTFMSWVTRPRIYAYSILSTLVAFFTVAIAFSERSNFYAAVVFLGRSNGCLLILLNFLLVIALVAGRILQLLFFGQLRRSEVELVCERSWYSLVGTLLAVSIFRDDFSVSFVILFGVLLFLKIFHWLSAERVASIMQSPSVPRIFHARMVSILTTLLLADAILVGFSMQMLLVKKIKVGMMVLFTSEFIILTALLLNTIAQYVLNCIDMASEEPWEAKSLYVLYVDLAHDVVRLCTHTYFFVLLTRMYGIPLSLIHDLYSAGRSCTTKVSALIRYRQAVKKMETKYPNATAADLQATDGTCIICREDMVASDVDDGAGSGSAAAAAAVVTKVTPKKLSCGHIFHFRCLRSWLERQQSCPTCRRMILDDEPEPTTAPQPPVVPPVQPPQQQQQRQQQQNGAVPEHASAPAPSGSAASSRPAAATPAEEAYETRLQGFLQRLQSDLHKVREEGNLSARHASSSRRRTSRSGYSTPRSAAGHAPSLGPNGAGAMGGVPRQSMGSKLKLADAIFAPHSHMHGGVSDESGLGGLWMPPPPSTLYAGGRRPQPPPHTQSQSRGSGVAMRAEVAEGEDGVKGKGKAKEASTAAEALTDEDEPVDPVDPREAIRAATLKRFGQPNPPSTSTSSTAQQGQTTEDAPSPAIGMIPLFDPSSIPDFHTNHVDALPHPLLPAAHSADDPLPEMLHTKTLAVKDQIAHLAAIQSRIDTVITDLTRVLDAIAPDSTTQARAPVV